MTDKPTDPTAAPVTPEGRPQEADIPAELPILPVEHFVLFPSIMAPIIVGDDKDKRLVDEALAAKRIVGVVTRKPEAPSIAHFADLHSAGTVANILKMLKMPDGSMRLLLHGVRRFRIVEPLREEPYLVARVEVVEEQPPVGNEPLAIIKSIHGLLARAIELSQLPEDLGVAAMNIADPGRLSDYITANLNLKIPEQIQMLDTLDVGERLRQLHGILTREVELLEIGEKIQTQVKSEIDRSQRDYMLRQQVKAIRKELGEDDAGSQQLDELRERIAAKKMPAETRAVADKELERLGMMQPSSPEYTVSRTYIEWILDLPWEEHSKDVINIRMAQEILDEDHYDLEKVKERILEFLSVLKLKKDMKGPILCLAGPPGVGKTSLGKSIARSLHRQFHRISLGGMRDEAEIRGHRRTYIGAMPGRIIKALKTVGTNNPVIMLDEIDKLASDYRGDPSSALLEVLDPEQNHTFTDNYLDMPFDLSRVLFITTANMLDTVPGPLRDRMEVITLSGYTVNEKLQIARKYLVPRQLADNGIARRHVSFTDSALRRIIEDYTREAGLRNLERTIGSVCRKVAHKVALGRAANAARTRITPAALAGLLGPPLYFQEAAQRMGVPGVAIGLAWTAVGGEILFIECGMTRGSGRLLLTGQLGDVMKESAQAALTYLLSHAGTLEIDAQTVARRDIHIHIPAGAVPKDGPSAGITMCAALASLLSGKLVKDFLAMTGEITLKGHVLPVGGIKEKVLAAARAGIRKLILPKRNEKDLDQIPAEVRKTIEFHFVDKVDAVLKLALVEPKPAKRHRPERAKSPVGRRKTAAKKR
jgi:ATP-dependent Lon protease